MKNLTTFKVPHLPIMIGRTLYAFFFPLLRKACFSSIRIWIIPLLILTTTITLQSRSVSLNQGFVKLISLVHDYGCGGSIEYGLLGNASDYTYYWKHGPKTLKITDLEPGVYTFVVRDLSGCVREFPTTVLDLSSCAVQIIFSGGPTPCDIYVTVAPLDVDVLGFQYGQITWSDGGPGVYKRLLSKDLVESGTLSFVYSQIIDGQICCDTTGVIVPGEDWEEAPEGGCIPACDYEITVEETIKECIRLITIIPDSLILADIDEPTFIVRWSDGLITSSLNRKIAVRHYDFVLHGEVSIFDLYTCSEVCRSTFTVKIEADSRCRLIPPDPEDQLLAINEFGTIPGDTSSQYIELLVTGGGDCGGYSDLRGIIIDDNNGDLIPAGQFIHKYNRHLIGINEGFIYFAYHEAWAEVPNGSLIVLYSKRDAGGVLPPDDPYDADEDHVYVLSFAEETLFRGKTSEWNEAEKEEEYQGILDEITWDKILISGPADGIQVRLPSGDYMHGLSTGATPLALPVNPFNLWLGELNADLAVCRLEGSSPYEWEEFQCTPYTATAVSPGLPNSEKNASLRIKLLSCNPEEEELPAGGEEGDPVGIEAVQVTIDADTSSYSTPGQLITYTITVTNTGNTVLTDVIVEDEVADFYTVIPVLLPCETRTFTFTHEVTCKDLANESGITNTVTVSGKATATDAVHISNHSINLSITKTATLNFIEGVPAIQFSLKLKNLSPNEATGVSVEDYLPNDGYSGVFNISNGGQLLSSAGSTSIIGWEDLVVPADDDLILSFDAILIPEGSNYENCAEIISSAQYNVQAPPCDETPLSGISSCVEPEICQLSASIVAVDYQDNGTPLDPFDDVVYFEILVAKPLGVPGSDWNVFNSSAGNFDGNFDIPESIGPFPVGFEAEWLDIQLKGTVYCKGTLLISSPAVLGDWVWNDENVNGLQDANEPGIPEVEVALKQGETTVATTATSSTGHYLFTNLDPGTYQVAFTPPVSDWETIHSIDFQANIWLQIPTVSANTGFSLSGFGATGLASDKCARSSFMFFNAFISVVQQLSNNYEYRIRWNLKNGSNDPAHQKILQLRYNTTATHTGTDIGAPYTLPQIAANLPGAEYVSEVFSGLSGTYHLILAPAPGNSSANVNCYFDDFRLERRLNTAPLVPTTQNIGNDETADSDIDASGLSDPVTLEAGDIYLDLDAGFGYGIELLGGNFPEESQVLAAEMSDQDALLVYPNPFTETCRLRLGSIVAGDGIVTLYSALSQRILDVNTNLVFGSNDMKLALPESLPAGVYTVEVQFPSGKILTQKITKIRL